MNMYKIYTHYHYSILSYLFNIIFIGCCFHDPRLTIFPNNNNSSFKFQENHIPIIHTYLR